MAAVTQIRHRAGRAFYDRKITEGKTPKEALRALKRRVSNALYARLLHDARQAAEAAEKGPGGQPGSDSDASPPGSRPATPALRPSHSRTRPHPTAARRTTRRTSRGPASKAGRKAS